MKLTGLFSRQTYVTCAFALSLLPAGAQAYIDGEIIPVGGPHQYNIDVGNQDITSNVAGSLISSEFALGGLYAGTAYCNTPMTNQPVFFTSRATLAESGNNPGYLRLNDYMDVKIEIYIRGNRLEYLPVPFNNESNRAYQNTCAPPSVQYTDFESGSKGRVTFMITKPIINGVNLVGTQIAELYGRIGSTASGIGSVPMSVIYINSGVLTVPDKCVVNQGTPIVVDFGTIPGTGSKLNGNNYSHNVPIHVKCEGGSFTTGSLNIKLAIQQASPASFNSDYLGTTGSGDRSNLGIKLTDQSGSTITPNRFYNVPGFNNNEGDWNLIAAPIANAGTNIEEGDFQASATVVAEFQ